MPIDHASREPDDDPPPVGHGPDAFAALFNPRRRPAVPAGAAPGPPAYDLRPLVTAAIALHGGQRSNTLTGRAFAEIVRIKFDLRDAPDEAWSRKVLKGLPYLTAYPGGVYRQQG